VAGFAAFYWTWALVHLEVVGPFHCTWLSWSSCLEGGGGWFHCLGLDLGSIPAGGGWSILLHLTGLGLWFSRGVVGLALLRLTGLG
jgi:hypothetical protein